MFDYVLSHLQQRSSGENNLKMPASILLTIQTMQDSSTIQKNSYKIYDILIKIIRNRIKKHKTFLYT